MIIYRKYRLVRELVDLARAIIGVVKAIIELIDMAQNYGNTCPTQTGSTDTS
jgi:hypothetical protein